MLRRVMVVVLLGCVGLTAGVTLGTLFPSSVVRAFTPLRTSCQRLHSGSRLLPPNIRVHHTASAGRGQRGQPAARWSAGGVGGQGPRNAHVRAPDVGCPSFAGRLIHRGVSMGGYVLLGSLAGLSAALGFLVPPRSRLTRR